MTLNSSNTNTHASLIVWGDTYELHKLAVPVGLSEALIGIYEVRLQLQGLFECLNGFLTKTNRVDDSELTGSCNREQEDKP